VANVVFPTGIDRRDDLGLPDRFDVYYGMADNRIGVARLDVPEHLPHGALVDAYDPRADSAPTTNLKEPWKQATGVVIPRNSTLTKPKAAQDFCARTKSLGLKHER
jgi:hypothetical protein